MKYVTKPGIAIEAIQRLENNDDEIMNFIGDRGTISNGIISIATFQGVMIANKNDYVIKNNEGEFYPCKPSIFEDKYENAKD